ncbi:MAG: hypothetical protein AB1Z55_09445 [Acidimicrobiia bacterium]
MVVEPFLSAPAVTRQAQPDKNEVGAFLSAPAVTRQAQPDKNGGCRASPWG